MKIGTTHKKEKPARALATHADAMAALAIMAVLSDGKLRRREMDALKEMLFLSPLFHHISHADQYLRHIAAVVAGTEQNELLDRAAKLLSPRLREAAYAWAVYQVAADSKFAPDEHAFLNLLRKKLGLHGALSGKIKAVVPMLLRAR